MDKTTHPTKWACRNCCFFDPNAGCRRHPPQPIVVRMKPELFDDRLDDFTWEVPLVKDDEWCGEFQKMPIPEDYPK